MLYELEEIENEIYQYDHILRFEKQHELAEGEEVLNEFQNQQIEFQQVIQDWTRLIKLKITYETHL